MSSSSRFALPVSKTCHRHHALLCLFQKHVIVIASMVVIVYLFVLVVLVVVSIMKVIFSYLVAALTIVIVLII
jgi:hypothetical protein